MPYYLGVEDPGWDEYTYAMEQSRSLAPHLGPGEPAAHFQYVKPWQSEAVRLQFLREPGPPPPLYQRPPWPQQAPSAPKRGFLSWLFGSKPVAPVEEPAPAPQFDAQRWHEEFLKEQASLSARGLHDVASVASVLRAKGVRYLRGYYDGGGDESFTYLQTIELADGRTFSSEVPDEDLPNEITQGECEDAVRYACDAMMGRFDAGEFTLHGALIIDLEECTISDETDRDAVFANRNRGEN